MKTLVIHPDDRSTDFLRKIYEKIDVTLIKNPCTSKDKIRKEIEKHDRIIMCGHGSPGGLFDGGVGFIINHTLVDLLHKKECIFIWCNADKFVEHYNLSGLYSGMFISEVGEASMYNYTVSEKEIYYSNNFFSALVGNMLAYDYSLKEIFKTVKENYTDTENEIIKFNNNRMYYAENDGGLRVSYNLLNKVNHKVEPDIPYWYDEEEDEFVDENWEPQDRFDDICNLRYWDDMYD